MIPAILPLVMGKDGLLGRLETARFSAGAPGDWVLIRLENGRQIYIPKESLQAQEDDTFFVPFSLQELEAASGNGAESGEAKVTVPLVAEELHVGTRIVETGRVRLHTTVQEREEVVDEPLLREEVIVERVPIHRLCDGPAPEVRQEGNLTIIPVLEEVLVVQKRWMLKEELHVRREQSTFHDPQHVTVRYEEVEVERVATDDSEPKEAHAK